MRLFPSRVAAADLMMFLAAFLVLLYGALLAYVRYGTGTPFEFFAADAFYYLNIARRSESFAFFTYDGVHATNGFHPLWQWLLTGMFRLLGLKEASDQQLLLDYFLCAALAAIGFGFLAVAARRVIRVGALALLFTVPGCFELLFSRVMLSTADRPESAPWLTVNGMETGLSLLWFGLLAWLLLRRPVLAEWSLPRLTALSALLSLLVLTRLDDVFLLVAIIGAVLWWTGSRRPYWQTLLAVAAVPAAAIGAYLVYNIVTTDMLLPVSSSMKRDFGALPGNLRNSLQMFFPTRLLDGQLYVWWWDALNWRSLQLLGPMAVALVFLSYCLLAAEPAAADQQRPFIRRILIVLAAYVLAKGGYNLLFVPLFAQGHWYFPLSIASANLMLAFLADRLLAWRGPGFAPDVMARLGRALRYLGGFAVVLGAGLALVSYSTSRLVFAICVVLVPGLLLLLLAGRIVGRAQDVQGTTWRRLGSGLSATAAGVFAVMYANAIVNQKLAPDYGDVNYEFWKSRQLVAEKLAQASPGAKLFELDDGLMAYALDVPVMSGFGLATDAKAYHACRAQRCIDVAYERGYRLASSVQYWGYLYEQRRGFQRPETEGGIIDSLVGSGALEPTPGAEDYDFRVAFSVPTGRYVVHFLEFSPKRRLESAPAKSPGT